MNRHPTMLETLAETLWRLKAGEPAKDIARSGPRQTANNTSRRT